MKRNYKYILNTIVFVVIFAIYVSYMSFMLVPRNSVDFANVNGLYSEKKNSIDAVYYGGSACYVYYQPLRAYEKYGFTSYDYASNTVEPEVYQYWIKESLKTQKPDLLIIDARAFQYREKDQPPTNAAYHNAIDGLKTFSLNKLAFINKYVGRDFEDDKVEYIFNFSQYHTAGVFSWKYAIRALLNKTPTEFKGWAYIVAQKEMERPEFETEEVQPIAKASDEILDELLNCLDKAGVKALFVISPYMETAEHKKMFNYVEKRVTERGYDFLDANEYYDDMGIDFKRDFYNESHVTVYGSEKYTDFLSEYIVNKYNLKDHRNDPYYSEWDNSLEGWDAFYNQAIDNMTRFEAEK